MNPIRSDQRWTVTREFTGKAKPQFVIRFCGDWIDSRSTYPAAVTRAVGAKALRDGALVLGEQRTTMPEPLIIHGSQRPFNSGFDSDAAWLDDIQRQVGGKRGYQGKHGAAHWLKLTNAKHSRGVAQSGGEKTKPKEKTNE